MLSFINNPGLTFRQELPEEITGGPDNAGRGWYHIYTFYPGVIPYQEPVLYEGERLALVLLNIGAFRERELDDGALRDIQTILSAFADQKVNMIVRACYDTEGKGMVKEPSLFSLVKKHLEQIGRLMIPYSSRIFVYQGLLIGNWGEMHESKFLSSRYLKESIECFFKATGGKIPLAVRKPVQYRSAFAEGISMDRFGFFNDGMLGTVTHMGTFACETAGRGAWDEMWSPEEELRFLSPFIDQVPYGGEVLMPAEKLSAQETVDALKQLRVSYLNSTHDMALLEQWKNTPYGEGNLYEYIGDHLGYRFVIRQAQIRVGKRVEVSVTIENTGFGELYEDAKVILWGANGPEAKPGVIGTLEGELRGAGNSPLKECKGSFEKTGFFADIQKTPACFYLSLEGEGQEPILFAQKSADGRVFLGMMRKGR